MKCVFGPLISLYLVLGIVLFRHFVSLLCVQLNTINHHHRPAILTQGMISCIQLIPFITCLLVLDLKKSPMM